MQKNKDTCDSKYVASERRLFVDCWGASPCVWI